MAYVHFGLATYDQSTAAPASEFNPTSFDANQWVTALASAGFHQVVLVAKHYDGFCLWPSAYTDYSVKASPWKGGKGDVVREFTDAARAAGLRVGLYLSPWDENFPSTGDGYEAYLRNQLTELLSNYGPIAEIKFPGNIAPAGVDWAGIAQLAHELQPETLVWMGPENRHVGCRSPIHWQSDGPGPPLDVERRGRPERRPLECLVPGRRRGAGSF